MTGIDKTPIKDIEIRVASHFAPLSKGIFKRYKRYLKMYFFFLFLKINSSILLFMKNYGMYQSIGAKNIEFLGIFFKFGLVKY